MSRVIATVAWPSISETTFGLTFSVSNRVAAVWRRSRKRISANPARFRRGLNERREVVAVEGRADRGGEDEFLILVEVSDLSHLVRWPRAVALQGFDGGGGETHAAATLGSLRDGELFVRVGAADPEHAVFEIKIVPPKPEQLALPQAGMNGKHVESLQAVTGGGIEQLAGLLGRQRFDLLPRDLRWVHRLGDVPGNEAPPEGLLERPMNNYVDMLDRAGAETGIKLRTVERLQVGGGELLEFHTPDRRDDVRLNETGVAVERHALDAAPYRIIEPADQVLVNP